MSSLRKNEPIKLNRKVMLIFSGGLYTQLPIMYIGFGGEELTHIKFFRYLNRRNSWPVPGIESSNVIHLNFVVLD